jgi:broad-specificity NMP kinase
MILAISGTPGTGKTSASRRLSEMTGWDLIGLN